MSHDPTAAPSQAETPAPKPTWGKTLARLVRLPAVFTAPADVLLGAWLGLGSTLGFTGHVIPIVALCLASACLYAAGMVFNDVFDLEQDRRERPGRPIPSGAIRRSTAAGLGAFLMLLGLALASVPGGVGLLVALPLVGAILLYDGPLKATVAGPQVMGLCRVLNVGLGLSLATELPAGLVLVPLANGLYVTGLTWFARREAADSDPRVLRLGVVLMLAGLVAHAAGFAFLPGLVPQFSGLGVGAWIGWVALVALVIWLGRPIVTALREPEPPRVQQAVRAAVLGLLPLDALVTLGYDGFVPAAIIIALFFPARLTGRWLSAT